MPMTVQAVLAAVLGAIAGSFANVGIYRLPRRESVVHPRSRCPACGHPIRSWDNIPVLSFLLLRGRCRDCGARISWRYPLVELGTAALFLGAWRVFGPTLEGVRAALFGLLLVMVIFVDLDHRIIPDRLTVPAVVLGLTLALAEGPRMLLASVLAAAAAGGFFLLVAVASRGGMGGGDIKLAAAMGAFLGWPAIAAALFVSFMLGGAVGIAVLIAGLRGRKDAIPFGPFLAGGGLVGMFWGKLIIQWYLG